MSKKDETVAVSRENAISQFVRETRGELRKVVWPTREEAWRLTLIVLGVTLAFAIFLWAMDTMFHNMIRIFIEQIIGM